MILQTYVEHSFFKLLATFISLCCVRVRSVFRSLFITGPSEPPRLIPVAYMPSDPLLLFSWQPHEREARRTEKGVGTKLGDEPTYFHVGAKLPRVPAAPSRGARPSCGGMPPQLSGLQLDGVTDRRRGQQSSQCRPAGMLQMRDDFAVTHFDL